MQTVFNVMTKATYQGLEIGTHFVASFTRHEHAEKLAEIVNGFVDDVVVDGIANIMQAIQKGYERYDITIDSTNGDIVKVARFTVKEAFYLGNPSFRSSSNYEQWYYYTVWASNEDHAIRLVNQMLYDDGVIDVYGE